MSAIAAARLPDADLRRESAKTVKTVSMADIQHGRKSSEKPARSRQNSLRKTKNSTDLLRERSLQRAKISKEMAFDLTSGAREGKGGQFTVANVGNNGMIFLRPVAKPAQPKAHNLPSFTFPEPSPISTKGDSVDSREMPKLRKSMWTNMSPAVWPAQSKASPRPQVPRQRSFSQSTIDARITNQKLDGGAFKIVIDRTDEARGSQDQKEGELPNIRVSIPHYRLGTPRFSARGTAFLHQSIYTRSSLAGEYTEADTSSMLSGDYDQAFPRPPGVEAQAVLPRRHSHASPQPYSIQTAHGPSFYTTIGPQAYTLPQPTGPISPHIYDDISQDPHDPTKVKYSPINGEILAATPARIVAQITSENFLDYELLSDFFLTVRSYLTTQDLLSYLLARFEWAINRFDDNGRVIRVRAFAALRHWILNYFSYDFVVDRDLRVQFCDRLNALTRIVKARADYGASDMKLIADLKKCWNGRCALFWDNAQYNADGQQDLDILPGGIVGSRDSQLINQSQLRFTPVATAPRASANPGQLAAGAPSLANWYTTVMEHNEAQLRGHNRQTSTATSRSLPISPTSEISMPIVSCSIPARSFRRAFPYANRALGIHPIPTDPQGRRICPPAPSAYAEQRDTKAVHRRSGSFSDAARDRRAPLSEEMPEALDSVQASAYQETSLLRGHGIVPSAPWVRPIAMAPPMELSTPSGAQQSWKDRDSDPPRKSSSSRDPAVKSIFGNIRRALSSKHGGTPGASDSGATGPSGYPVPTLPVGKSSQVPFNVVYQASLTSHLEPFKTAMRIDLLAAEVFETYKDAVNQPAEQAMNLPDNIGVALGNESQQPSPFGFEGNRSTYGFNDRLQPPELKRFQSTMTESSQSILIMDDTGGPTYPIVSSTNPAMTLINTMPMHVPIKIDTQEVSPISNHQDSEHATHPTYQDEHISPVSTPASASEQSRYHNDLFNIPANAAAQPPARPSLARKHSGVRNTKTSSISLRRYASYQSTFSKHGHGMSIDTTISRKTDRASSVRRIPARALRRRPGGDLRANQNVHDLEEHVRPRSAGSVTTYSESVRNSDVLGFGEKIARTFTMQRPSHRTGNHDDIAGIPAQHRHSMIRTHSSMPEKRRPSFEAAVAEFAQIPDDEEGGIEATLLKLEGRYKSPVQSPTPNNMHEPIRPNNPEPPSSTEQDFPLRAELPGSGDEHSPSIEQKPTDSGSYGEPIMVEDIQSGDVDDILEDNRDREPVVSTMYAGSEDSYNSVPLLERGADVQDDATDKDAASVNDKPPAPSQALTEQAIAQHISTNLRSLRYGSAAPTATTDSFLLDEEDDFLSDLSSELSSELSDGTVEPMSHEVPPPDILGSPENLVTLGQHHPPSPPMTMENAIQISTQASHAHELRKPPTPDPSPISQPAVPEKLQEHQFKYNPNGSQHLCFILGHETDLIVQQLTLLEKDALREVDWRDLVDMRWQTTATTTTNWCDFLLSQDPLGVDLVTARFNIMVKWALSEIVMTEKMEERALTIVKYIHIAHQARQVHNYATLLQITVALTSADCTRLGKTWNMVPEAEREILQDLEMLVSPKKNFYNLRAEMEKANADRGCIPVVVLYLHDLTYNAQKPSRIPAAAGDGEALVNFERYRSTAVIVKSLLRLIDASTKYEFQPLEGLIDRCLWMAALPDEIISYKSKQLEWGPA